MLHLLWVGAVLGLLAAVSRRLLKSAGPETRHAAALVWLLLLRRSPVVIFLFVFEPRVIWHCHAQVASVRVSEASELCRFFRFQRLDTGTAQASTTRRRSRR